MIFAALQTVPAAAQSGVTLDVGLALALIMSALGALGGTIAILWKANSALYKQSLDDARSERDYYRNLLDLSLRQGDRSLDMADRTVKLVERGRHPA